MRARAFRALWLAQAGSFIGTWMQTVGAQWLLVDAPAAETLVALVQAAAMAPALFLALPAGALADMLDRRRLLIGVQVFQACVAIGLTALTLFDRISPAILLTFTFLLGCGIALTMPAYQALSQELVPREEVRAAAALGGVATNGARAVGPALAGLIIAQVGPAAVFALNALSYVILTVVLLRVRRPPSATGELPERFTSAIRAGQRYVRHSLPVRRMLLRAALFVLPGAALWALLPLVASRLLRVDSTGYGILLAALGLGAILGAHFLPRVAPRLSSNGVLLVAGLAFAASLAACVVVTQPIVLAALLVPAGLAWLWVIMTVSGELQAFLPEWVRARGLSTYNVVFAGGQAVGAVLWGAIAQAWGLVTALLLASAVMALGTGTVLVWPLRNVTGLSREHVVFMPDPDIAHQPHPEDGPIVVTLTYTVDEDKVPAFLAAMAGVGQSRLRTGATSSTLYQDGADPSRFVQLSEYPTWGEHLRQHTGRLTGADQGLYEAARSLATAPPEIRHMFPPQDRS